MIFVLLALAVARVTRFVTSDVLSRPLRQWTVTKLLSRGDGPHRTSGFRYELAYLVTCDWCASIYVGAAFAGAWYAWGETMWLTAVCAALAASYVAGYLNTRAGD